MSLVLPLSLCQVASNHLYTHGCLLSCMQVVSLLTHVSMWIHRLHLLCLSKLFPHRWHQELYCAPFCLWKMKLRCKDEDIGLELCSDTMPNIRTQGFSNSQFCETPDFIFSSSQLQRLLCKSGPAIRPQTLTAKHLHLILCEWAVRIHRMWV